MIDSEKLRELIAKRDKFLGDHPHLKPFQDKLDRKMEGMNSEERMSYLSGLMTSGLKELSAGFKNLKGAIES